MQSLLFYSKQGSYFQQIGIYFMFTKKVTQNMKKWRPITLINVLYKHISGCISYQIRPTLSYIISDTQTGFLKRRYIGENTRFIQNLHMSTDNENIHGLLFLIDIQKAFDSVSWSFIHKALEDFGFENNIINWITFSKKIIRLLFYNVATCHNSSKSKEDVDGDTLSVTP